MAAQRPGCQGAYASARTSSGTRQLRPTARAASIASAQDAARPLPHQPSSSRAPVSTAPIRSGWSGRAASREASSAGVGPRSTGRIGADAGAPGRGLKTRPISNSAVSAKPRPTLRASTRNRPGSTVVRSSGSSSLSGLATSTAGRRGSSSGSPSRSASARDPNGEGSTSTKPASASVRPAARRHLGRGVGAARYHLGAGAAQAGQQGDGLGAGAQRELAVHAALEPVGGLAVQLVAAAHLGRALGGEVRRLDDQVGGGLVDLGV